GRPINRIVLRDAHHYVGTRAQSQGGTHVDADVRLHVRGVARKVDGRVGEVAQIRIDHIEGAQAIVPMTIGTRVTEAHANTGRESPLRVPADVAGKSVCADRVHPERAVLA